MRAAYRSMVIDTTASFTTQEELGTKTISAPK
jgi:hypothetical protein